MKDRLELLCSRKDAEKEINERIKLGKELKKQPAHGVFLEIVDEKN